MAGRMFAVACVAIALIGAGCDSTPTHESVVKDTIGKMKEMVAVLKGVKDEPTAKAAKPKMEAIGKEMKALKAEMDKLPKPSAEEEKRIQDKYQPELETVTGEMMREMMRVGLDPNLAPHLKDAMPSDL